MLDLRPQNGSGGMFWSKLGMCAEFEMRLFRSRVQILWPKKWP
jgi:hypothetical protein